MSEVQTAESLAAPVDQANEVNDQAVNEGEQQASSQQEAEEGKKQDSPKWATRRISELTRDKYKERARAEMLEQELQKYRSQQPSESTQQPARQEDVQALAERIAEQKLAEREAEKKLASLQTNGEKEFKDEFRSSMETLRDLGAMDNTPNAVAFSEAVLDSDIPHKILHHLGTNPEEAERILALKPIQQARAIGQLEAQLREKPAPETPVSKAPPPVKPVGSRSPVAKSPNDMTMEEYVKYRQKQMEGRG